ncbi:MAG: HPr family phosphocarrier protein [Fastidiosipilaceae bacterium]|jgi:phosphocarrier protein HPr|nr:HPr family phosphocarrier protein [Clostridiaceae bacterium]
MFERYVLLDSVNAVKDFVRIVNDYPFDVDLLSGRYVVDGKSIMGIFSLNLKAPVLCHIHGNQDTDERMKSLIEKLTPYIQDK